MAKLALYGGKRVLSKERNLKSTWREMSLERALSEYTGAKYVKCVSSGTGALVSALVAAGVGAGDEVITVAYTWVATVSSIFHVNAIPVFVDIDPETFCIDPNQVKQKMTPATKAILAVDLYGHPAPIPELLEIGRQCGVVVIEDACQASSAKIHGSRVGSIADITAFSWAGKPIHSVHDAGGAYCTNTRDYYERGMLAGQHPFMIFDECSLDETRNLWSMGGLGNNYRPVGLDALENLIDADVRTKARRKNCEFLSAELVKIPWITTPTVRCGYEHAFHFFACRWNEMQSGVTRDKFCEALAAEGLEVWAYVDMIRDFSRPVGDRPPPAGPMHLRTAFKQKNFYGGGCPFNCVMNKNIQDYGMGSLPISEICCKEEFCVPQQLLSPPCDEEDMRLILKVITKVIENLDELR